MKFNVHTEFVDNSDDILEMAEEAMLRALVRCGAQARTFAVKKIKANRSIDNGDLLNSIAFKVEPSEKAAYVGSNVDHAIYVEMGTGKYYAGGRQGWWVYVKGGSGYKSQNPGKVYTFEQARKLMIALRKKGLDAHMTCGQPAKPFLKPAVADHKDTYRNIMRDEMENA